MKTTLFIVILLTLTLIQTAEIPRILQIRRGRGPPTTCTSDADCDTT